MQLNNSDAVISIYQELVRRDIERIMEENRGITDEDVDAVIAGRKELRERVFEMLVPTNGGYHTMHGLLVKLIKNTKFLPFKNYTNLVEIKAIYGDDGLPGLKYPLLKYNILVNDVINSIESEFKNNCPKIKEAAKLVLEGMKKSGVDSLSSYQYDYIVRYIRTKCKGNIENYLIDSPTGTGKTIIFTFIALVEALLGNRVLIIYPRKQLAEDQANRLLRYIYYVRSELDVYRWQHIFNFKKPILAIADGDHPNSPNDRNLDRRLGKIEGEFVNISRVINKTLRCPQDSSELLINIKNGSLLCSKNKYHKYDYIYIYKEDLSKANIVITNRFVLLTRLLHDNVKINSFLSNVSVIILDEAHVYTNLEGGDTALTIRKIDRLIREVNRQKAVTWVLSSATIPHPLEFASDLVGSNNFVHFDYNSYGSMTDTHRLVVPLLVLPTPRFSAETVAQFIALLTLLWTKKFDQKAIMFVDSRSEISRLMHYIKETILEKGGIDTIKEPGDIIKYNTSWGIRDLQERNQRYRDMEVDNNSLWDLLIGNRPDDWGKLMRELYDSIEQHYALLSGEVRTKLFSEFKEGSKRLLVATSTLELGVDFPDVSVIIQYKLPFKAENLIQRLGRAGRSEESYRIVLGIVILSQSPQSSAYMYDEELQRRLIDVSVLPKPPVNISNVKLKLRHDVYDVLIERKQKGKSSDFPRFRR